MHILAYVYDGSYTVSNIKQEWHQAYSFSVRY